jgi:ATP-binding cassette subfamily G (WHITE) protein 2 (PDR)
VFNIFMAVLLYYLVRVRRGSGRTLGERFGWVLRFLRRDAGEDKKGGEKGEGAGDEGGDGLVGSGEGGEY